METSSVVLPDGEQQHTSCIEAENIRMDDRISKLPDDILFVILSFLTIRDAVRLRVLSRSWRYLCAASRPNLDFNLFTILGCEYNPFIHGYKFRDGLRFIRAVNQVLQLCTSTKIYLFRVSCCLGKESATQINSWIRFAVRMQAEKLELCFRLTYYGCEYTFPYHLLPQNKTSQLKHLCLRGCVLKPLILEKCFHSLKTIELTSIILAQNSFNAFLSSCVSLESLKLKDCKLPHTYKIGRKLRKLKLLVMCNCNGPSRIGLSSTSLETFEYVRKYNNTSILYVDVPSLWKLHLSIGDGCKGTISYTAKGLGRDFPWLKALSLTFITYQPIPAEITKLSHLKELELFVFTTPGYDLVSIASILNAAPSLQRLHLAIQENLIRQPTVGAQYTKQFYYQLKTVEISGFSDECNALEAARYLISHAIGLEQMIITKQRRHYNVDGDWSYYKCPKMDESEKERVYSVLSKEKTEPDVEIVVS